LGHAERGRDVSQSGRSPVTIVGFSIINKIGEKGDRDGSADAGERNLSRKMNER